MNDSQSSGLSLASAVDSEVPSKPRRRTFTAEYKKRILEEADAAKEKGAIGALMRRERIYSSTLSGWRKEREAAVHQAFSQKRGPHPKSHPLTKENDKLRRQNQRLQEDLEKARIVIEVQKKVARLLRELPAQDEEQ